MTDTPLSDDVVELLKRIYLAGHSEGWTGNQQRRDVQHADAEKGWSLYVKNGALDRAVAARAGEGELLPCPFCGCTVIRDFKQMNFGGPKQGHVIDCNECNGGFHSTSREQSVERWNTRALLSSIGASQP